MQDGSVLVAALAVGDGVEDVVGNCKLTAVAGAKGVAEEILLCAALTGVLPKCVAAGREDKERVVGGSDFVRHRAVIDRKALQGPGLVELKLLVDSCGLGDVSVALYGFEKAHLDWEREIRFGSGEE